MIKCVKAGYNRKIFRQTSLHWETKSINLNVIYHINRITKLAMKLGSANIWQSRSDSTNEKQETYPNAGVLMFIFIERSCVTNIRSMTGLHNSCWCKRSNQYCLPIMRWAELIGWGNYNKSCMRENFCFFEAHKLHKLHKLIKYLSL